ncbi:60S acidic ribosomal protein P1 [Lithohypha guttulata]|uniref:Large ribosomal subunit protein P1 n=1 Tax=Lithohypha guttulata TaxID=1690604 RepID=A0AAN7YAR5_9EURO|nr:60S acidic ribosomal protein P1 [Lithohypha guttulata]KAK5091752.1 60S acidic ribosomal protein P1 [Lithohypha guttulata]KAK5096375.1 60S acidic ribosomal protein P1 [Lithohypha guttulata]
MSTAELAASYAALILADDGVDITADKLNSIIKAAGVPDVEPIWATLFAKALEGKDVKDMLLNVGSGGGAAPAAGAASGGAAAGGAAAADEPKEEEKKEEEKEESDEDMGFGLFD